jgi:hypothetical protein
MNENEFFAECFRRALLRDKTFMQQSPKSFEYILKNIKQK